MATNLFGLLPTISYTLDDGDSEQVVVDIFKRVILSKEFLENSAYFETYEILHGETPEEISYRFYGTTDLHWLVLMTNNIIDPRFEWPVSEENLVKMVQDKYDGANNIFTINRALNTKGYQVETFFLLTEDSTHAKPKRLMTTSNDPDAISSPIAYKDSAEISDYETNYEIEQTKNESYRNIKIIKPEIVQDILSNYRNLVAQ